MRSNQLSYLAIALKASAKIEQFSKLPKYFASFLRKIYHARIVNIQVPPLNTLYISMFSSQQRKQLYHAYSTRCRPRKECGMRFVANDAKKTTMLLRAINILTLIASILLLASLSVEILYSEQLAQFTDIYSWAMFSVCIIFLIDFFALMLHSPHPWRFLLRNFIVLALSIPYHTLSNAIGIEPNHTATIAMSSIVMLRSVMALYITMRWLISSRATRLLGAYIATVVVASYFGALLFYEYEAPVNNAVKGFGDAMWWAWMNLTTVGAEIFPVTTVGKLICVVLPILGMAMFPVFTVYVTSLYERNVAQRGTRVAPVESNQKQNNNETENL